MEWTDIVLLILVGMGAGFVQRVSGFGLGIFAMMFLPYFTPSYTAAATISTLFSTVTSTYNAIRYGKDTKYRIVIPMICATLLFVPIAVHFSSVVPADIFKSILGVVLIALSIYFLFFNNRIKMKPTVANGFLAGAIGGTLNGLFSTGGPPAVLYLTNTVKSNIAYFATIQFYFCFANLYSTAMRMANGLINRDILVFALVGILGCMVGDFFGKALFDKLDGNKLKVVIYVGMILSGIIMLF